MNNQIIQEKEQVTETLKKYAEMNSTDFYLFVSEKLRNYISDRDGQKHHYINVVDHLVSISMDENCFDTFTLQQIVKRMSKIANILNRFNKENIIEMNYHQFCNEISVDVKEIKVLFNMKELADMNLTTI